VLKREERKVGEPSDVVFRGVDPEDTTLVARPVAMIVHMSHDTAKDRVSLGRIPNPKPSNGSPPPSRHGHQL
jgi:hypothetical protein